MIILAFHAVILTTNALDADPYDYLINTLHV